MIKKGDFGYIQPRGRRANDSGIKDSQLTPEKFDTIISVITNDVNGKLVTIDI